MSGLPHPTLPHFVERMQRRLDDGDLLLVCGFGVPLLLVVVWVAAMAVARTPWLVLPIAAVVGAVVFARGHAEGIRRSRASRRPPS
jgi:hypothetical protein